MCKIIHEAVCQGHVKQEPEFVGGKWVSDPLLVYLSFDQKIERHDKQWMNAYMIMCPWVLDAKWGRPWTISDGWVLWVEVVGNVLAGDGAVKQNIHVHAKQAPDVVAAGCRFEVFTASVDGVIFRNVTLAA